MWRIETVPLQQATEGMVVAADVRDAQGTLLVGAGTALTARLIEELARRNIESVPGAVAHVPTAEERAEIVARLEERFACVRGQPPMDHLFDMVVKLRVEG